MACCDVTMSCLHNNVMTADDVIVVSHCVWHPRHAMPAMVAIDDVSPGLPQLFVQINRICNDDVLFAPMTEPTENRIEDKHLQNVRQTNKRASYILEEWENIKKHKHHVELQRTATGTKVTGEFSTRGHIFSSYV